jgi:2-phospho-L-lactate guanylyltransferase
MKVCALIPLKELEKSKSRLSNILNEKERIEFTLCMLKDVIKALVNSSKIDDIYIISQEKELKLSDERKFKLIFDSASLNEALERHIKDLQQYDAKIIIPCDIPLVSEEDVEKVIELLNEYDVVISPSCDSGTNLLAIKNELKFKLEFGEGRRSFIMHLKNALEANLKVYVYSSERIALDVDDDPRLKYLITLNIDKYSTQYIRWILNERNKNNSNRWDS